MPTIHELIKARRESLKWSQTKLATEVSKAAGIEPALVYQTVQQWERGDSAPRRAILPTVAKVLGLQVADLLLAGPVPDEAAPMELERALEVLSQELQVLDEPAKRRAATILGHFAQEPDGPWRNWLAELLTRPGIPDAPTHPVTDSLGKSHSRNVADESADYASPAEPKAEKKPSLVPASSPVQDGQLEKFDARSEGEANAKRGSNPRPRGKGNARRR